MKRMLSILAIFSVVGIRADAAESDLPVPVFCLKGSAKIERGRFPLAIPADVTGQVEGNVTADGKVLEFDGTGGQILFWFDAGTLFSSPFTAHVTVTVLDLNGYGDFLNSNAPAGFGVRAHANGTFDVSAQGWHALAGGKVMKGTEQHVAVTCDGNTMLLYVDGVQVGTVTLDKPPSAKGQIKIGNMGRNKESGDGLTDVPNCQISNIALFDAVLSPAQIAGLANGSLKMPDPAPVPAATKKPFKTR